MKYLSILIHLIFIIAIVATVLAMPAGAFALEATAEAGLPSREAGHSAIPANRIATTDGRAEKLETYLASHNSPLTPYAGVFVTKADEYGLDWRLVASISGVESTFGKKIPANSYNAYGWNGGNFYFKNWEDGIDTVSRTLGTKYVARGADTVWKIGPIYAPPSTTWATKVAYFMKKIEEGPKSKNPALELKLTI